MATVTDNNISSQKASLSKGIATTTLVKKAKKNSKGQNQYKLFFVDDDPMILKMLSRYFDKENKYDIQCFESGEACIESINEAPDIIVLDYNLSGEHQSLSMNGLDCLNAIKEKNPNVQVIMLSAQVEVKVAVDCLKKGAVNYVVKDGVMQFNVQKAIESITKSRELQHEINALSTTIKRDKLLMRGYGLIILGLLMTLFFFWML